MAPRLFVLPWQATPPVGLPALMRLTSSPRTSEG
jgi:hypothetical protein